MFLRYWTYNFKTINVHLVRKEFLLMNYLKDKEIFKRISFTFMMCLLFYVIGRIPLPLASTHKGNIIVENMLQLTAGTSQLSLFMLGVGPYITVTICYKIFNKI